jgi:hypothetical protein
MPWPPKQARAIILSYKRRGKTPPPGVEKDLSTSLKGKPMPKKHGRPKGRLKLKRKHRPPTPGKRDTKQTDGERKAY